MTISAIILTKNEEKNIRACIESLAWCDEVIVVDDNSQDKTLGIAKKLHAKIFEHSLGNDFSMQRNFALSQAKGDWVLFVDADERVPQTLAFEIQGKIAENVEGYQGFFIRRLDTMWGKTLMYGETGNIHLLRLAKKSAGKWVGKVHEVWEVKGRTSSLLNPLMHFPHPTITEFLEEINRYTTLRAEELYEKKIEVSWVQIIFYPKAKFIVNYFFKQGCKDGLPGLVSALLMSFHSFLVRGKLWNYYHGGQR